MNNSVPNFVKKTDVPAFSFQSILMNKYFIAVVVILVVGFVAFRFYKKKKSVTIAKEHEVIPEQHDDQTVHVDHDDEKAKQDLSENHPDVQAS